MISFVTTVALAQTPTADLIQSNVDRIYGKPVPPAAVCVAHPELGAPFQGAPTPVAVRRGARGCVLLGVVVGDQWYAPAAALPAAVDKGAWTGLDGATRETKWVEWVDRVLLAFDQPSPSGLAQVTNDAKRQVTVVDRRYWRRSEEPGRSADVVNKWTFDAKLVVASSTEQVLSEEDVSLFQRAEKVDGVSEAAVDQAITTKGLVIRKCMTQAWEEDLGLEGRVRLEWSLAAGKVSDIVILAEEETNDALAACYARAVKNASYPADAAGTVRWVFAVQRDPAK